MIYGLTDRESADIAPTVIAKVWKGTEKGEKRPGQDTLGEYFRFETEYESIKRVFLASVDGAKEENGMLLFRSMTIAFPYREDCNQALEIEKNFPTSYTAYDEKNKFIRSCNGQEITLKNDGGMLKRCNEPCLANQGCGCKRNGELFFISSELRGENLPFGVITLSNSSIYDISHISNVLHTLQDMFVSRTGHSVTGIPLILSKKQQLISSGANNKFGRNQKWMINLSVKSSWINEMAKDIPIEDIYKVFDYQSIDSKDKKNEVTIRKVDLTTPDLDLSHKLTYVDDVDYPNVASELFDKYMEKRSKGGGKPIIDNKPIEQPKQDLRPDDMPIKQPKKQDTQPQKTASIDPMPINKYLERTGLHYQDAFLLPPGTKDITLNDHYQQFCGELEQNLGIEESKAKQLLKSMGVSGFKFEDIAHNYNLLACTLEGAVVIVNELTNNKYLAQNQAGQQYKNFKYFTNSYQKADTTNQPLPKNGDGYGWCRVIDLLVARYEQEKKAGIDSVNVTEFANDMYTESPSQTDHEIVDDNWLDDYISDGNDEEDIFEGF